MQGLFLMALSLMAKVAVLVIRILKILGLVILA